jgi:hypothetical protein
MVVKRGSEEVSWECLEIDGRALSATSGAMLLPGFPHCPSRSRLTAPTPSQPSSKCSLRPIEFIGVFFMRWLFVLLAVSSQECMLDSQCSPTRVPLESTIHRPAHDVQPDPHPTDVQQAFRCFRIFIRKRSSRLTVSGLTLHASSYTPPRLPLFCSILSAAALASQPPFYCELGRLWDLPSPAPPPHMLPLRPALVVGSLVARAGTLQLHSGGGVHHLNVALSCIAVGCAAC